MPNMDGLAAVAVLREWLNRASLMELLYLDAALAEVRAVGVEERTYKAHREHCDPLGRPNGAFGMDAYQNWRRAVDARIRAQHARALLEAQFPS